MEWMRPRGRPDDEHHDDEHRGADHNHHDDGGHDDDNVRGEQCRSFN
jgi:hypothetical protein